MSIHTFTAGPFETNAYIIADDATRAAVAVDVPPEAFEPMRHCIRGRMYTLSAIVITHGHWDHFGDAAALMREFSVPMLCHPEDEKWIADPSSFLFAPPWPIAGARADRHLADGDIVEAGALRFRVLHVPGHSPGHVALFEPTLGALFSGDLLFAGSIGRVDFPGGNYEVIMRSIVEKVLTLPDETTIHSGHGPATTVGFERRNNPFILGEI